MGQQCVKDCIAAHAEDEHSKTCLSDTDSHGVSVEVLAALDANPNLPDWFRVLCYRLGSDDPELSEFHITGSILRRRTHSIGQSMSVTMVLGHDLIVGGGQDGNAAAQVLGIVLRTNHVLNAISFRYCQMTPEGASNLAKGLELNTSVEKVDIGNNQISCQGAKSLGKMLLVNETLKVLYMASNDIGDEGVKALSRALEVNTTLERIDVGDNGIHTEGSKALGRMLTVNKGLVWLSLEHNYYIGDDGKRGIVQGLESNFRVCFCRLSHSMFAGNSLFEELEFWISLNRVGRELLQDTNAPMALWPLLLANAGGNASMLYYFLCVKPDLVNSQPLI